MRRRGFLAAAGLFALATGAPAVARSASGRLVGCLAWGKPELYRDSQRGLASLMSSFGHREGRDIRYAWTFAGEVAEALDANAAELVAKRVDAIVAMGSPAARAAKAAGTGVPIVASVADPVAEGLAERLSRPGGTVTGLANSVPEVGRKQMELLRTILPGLRGIGILRGKSTYGGRHHGSDHLESAAREMGIAVHAETLDPHEFEARLAQLPRRGVGAIAYFPWGTLEDARLREMARAALRHRVAAMGGGRFVAAGFLVNYRAYHSDTWGRLAALLDKVLRGADPAAIPFEQPDRFHLALNRATARTLDVHLGPDLLLRADEVFG